MKQVMLLVLGVGMALGFPAAAHARFGAGVTSGLLAGDDELARALILTRLLDDRDDDEFAGGFLLGRILSPAERNLRARALVLARQRRLERELAFERALARERARLEREFLRDELRRRALRGYSR